MKLAELAAEPKLTKITIDSEDVVKNYGEPIEFWVYDRQEMDVFMKLASISDNDMGHISEVVSDIVLDENGNKIFKDGVTIPTDVMLKVIEEVVTHLGNGVSQTSKN